MSRRSLAALVMVFSVALAAWPCGPFFPNSYLVYGGKDYLRMPHAMFYVECHEILGIGEAAGADGDSWSDLPSAIALWQHTVSVDLSEFAEAVRGRPDADALIADYTELREALGRNIEAHGGYGNPLECLKRPDPFDLQPFEAIVSRLPEEFAEYIRGAVAYHNGDRESAAGRFAAVLALPPERRMYRSTWAAFMLGKCWLRKDPPKASTFFEQTRSLAAEGFRDSLNLSADSVGWQACADILAGAYPNAIHRYAEYYRIDPKNTSVAMLSLGVACERALRADPVDTALAQDDLCRRIITASPVSRWHETNYAAKWLACLSKIEPQGVVLGADRLAWLAYEAGDMAAAARWLEHCEPGAPCAQWIRAKLLLREGRLDEGAALLRQAAETISKNPPWEVMQSPSDWDSCQALELARGDLGFVSLKRGDYADALFCFLESDDWADAACMAERVLTPDELVDFVEAHAHDSVLVEKEIGYDPRVPVISAVRHLLARRLARLGDWDKAIPHFLAAAEGAPTESKLGNLPGQARRLAAHLAAASDTNASVREHAEHLFEAARILRANGMELTGAELEPDWALLDGSFELAKVVRMAADPGFPTDFGQRLRTSAIAPPNRFHYRYRAADMMWQCAAMLPRNDVLAAHALYLGGTYLKKRDPQAADRFYKALVNRNPNLLIAQKADKLRWFPKEFTDVVRYQPLPKHWYGSKRRVAAALPVMAVAAAIAVGVFLRRRRHPAPSVEEMAERIGAGVQLFRIRNSKRYFEEIAALDPMPDAMIARRRVWKLKGTDIYFALLSVPHKDIEDILVRADTPDWQTWDWSRLADVADGCRWRGPELDTKCLD